MSPGTGDKDLFEVLGLAKRFIQPVRRETVLNVQAVAQSLLDDLVHRLSAAKFVRCEVIWRGISADERACCFVEHDSVLVVHTEGIDDVEYPEQ